jgi:hypothetical protein
MQDHRLCSRSARRVRKLDPPANQQIHGGNRVCAPHTQGQRLRRRAAAEQPPVEEQAAEEQPTA